MRFPPLTADLDCCVRNRAGRGSRMGGWSGIIGLVLLAMGWLGAAGGRVEASCGHYVFTAAEWAVHSQMVAEGPAAERSLLAAVSGRPSDSEPRRGPCHGPGCRGGELPAGWVAPAAFGSERPAAACVLIESLYFESSPSEFWSRHQVEMGRDVCFLLLRPPRI